LRGEQAAQQGAHPGRRCENADERGRAAKTAAHDREYRRLGDAAGEVQHARDHDAAPHRDLAHDGPGAGGEFGEQHETRARQRPLGHPQQPEDRRRDGEAHHVEDGHGPDAERGVQRGAEQGTAEAQPLAHRLDGAVRVRQQVRRNHVGQQGGHRREQAHVRGTHRRRYGVDDPPVAALVHRDQRHQGEHRGQAHDDQEAPPGDAVDQPAERRRGTDRQHEEQHSEAGRARRPGQLKQHDARNEHHHRVARHAHHEAEEQQPEVCPAQHGDHARASPVERCMAGRS
jgi:hypothetical protein